MPHLAPASAVLFALCTPSLAQSEIYTLVGEPTPLGGLGHTAVPLGDVDGDGFDDFAISTPDFGLPAGFWGRVDAYSGRDGASLYFIEGTDPLQNLGFSMARIGDVDGDGIRDLALGGPQDSTSATSAGSVLVVSAADGTQLYRLNGEVSERIGTRLVTLPDLDADGIEDFAHNVRRSFGSPANSGGIRAVSAATGAELYAVSGSTLNDELGRWSLASIADIDGDGVRDIIAGLPTAVRSGQLVGAAQVRSGANGALLLEVVGTVVESRFGWSVAAIDDLDGDGREDLAIGAPRNPAGGVERGSVSLHSSASGALLMTWNGTLDRGEFGHDVAAVGDVDANGTGDLAIGAPSVSIPATGAGVVFVVEPSSGSTLYRLEGVTVGDRFGWSTDAVGDVDGDGYIDLAVGAPTAGDGVQSSGSARLVGREFVRGTPFCLGQLNSTGARASMVAVSASGFQVAANDTSFDANGLPPFANGYFLVSAETTITPAAGGSAGTLCLGGTEIGRYASQVQNSGAAGQIVFAIDLDAIPTPSGPIAAQPGDTLFFQLWYRDSSGGAGTSNFSDAVRVDLR